MATSWRYEFKKGKEAQCYGDLTRRDYCVYRNLLQDGHRECGVEVYDLLTGPMRNPVSEVVEDHTKRRLLSKPGVPEGGGICKYVKPSFAEFCGFCKTEAAKSHGKEMAEKEVKKIREINYLMRNLHRIRGASGEVNHQKGGIEQSDYDPSGVLKYNESKPNLGQPVHHLTIVEEAKKCACKCPVREFCVRSQIR